MIAQISNVFALHDDPAGRGNDGPAMMTMDDQEEEALTKPASTDDAHTRHFHVCLVCLAPTYFSRTSTSRHQRLICLSRLFKSSTAFVGIEQ